MHRPPESSAPSSVPPGRAGAVVVESSGAPAADPDPSQPSAPSQADPPDPPDPAATGFITRGIQAQAVIWLTVLFVLGMTALIWYRWFSVSLPTSNIIPIGDASVEGAEATITAGAETIGSVRLDKKDNYTGAIWLIPGIYHLKVQLNDRVINEATVKVDSMQSVSVFISLKSPGGATTTPSPSTTGPAEPAPRPRPSRSSRLLESSRPTESPT